MFDTKYGTIPKENYINYFERLIGKTYKILALKEEECPTLNIYIESLLYELIGQKKVTYQLRDETSLITIISLLEQLKYEDEHIIIKQKVFKIIKLIKNINSVISGDD